MFVDDVAHWNTETGETAEDTAGPQSHMEATHRSVQTHITNQIKVTAVMHSVIQYPSCFSMMIIMIILLEETIL